MGIIAIKWHMNGASHKTAVAAMNICSDRSLPSKLLLWQQEQLWHLQPLWIKRSLTRPPLDFGHVVCLFRPQSGDSLQTNTVGWDECWTLLPFTWTNFNKLYFLIIVLFAKLIYFYSDHRLQMLKIVFYCDKDLFLECLKSWKGIKNYFEMPATCLSKN